MDGSQFPLDPFPLRISGAEPTDNDIADALMMGLHVPERFLQPKPVPAPKPLGDCRRCHGTGRVLSVEHDGSLHFKTQDDCPRCYGTGERVFSVGGRA